MSAVILKHTHQIEFITSVASQLSRRFDAQLAVVRTAFRPTRIVVPVPHTDDAILDHAVTHDDTCVGGGAAELDALLRITHKRICYDHRFDAALVHERNSLVHAVTHHRAVNPQPTAPTTASIDAVISRVRDRAILNCDFAACDVETGIFK